MLLGLSLSGGVVVLKVTVGKVTQLLADREGYQHLLDCLRCLSFLVGVACCLGTRVGKVPKGIGGWSNACRLASSVALREGEEGGAPVVVAGFC